MGILRVLLVFAVAAVCLAQSRDAEFNKLSDRLFDDLVFHYDPASATQAGFHQYDSLMPTGARAEVDQQIADTKKFVAEIEAFDPHGLSPWAAADRDLALAQLRSQVLTLETIRPWEKNPDSYTSYVTSAIFVIMSRTYAPPAERLKAAIAREKLIPRMFLSARENLQNPPEVFTSVALEQLPGIAGFFEKDVPSAFSKVKDAALLAEFKKTNQGVIDALKAYESFLKTDVLPRSKGDFRIGAETYRKKLLYDEMVDTPLDRLLTIGYDDLHRNQAELKRVAAQIDPSRSAEAILQDLENDHPAAGGLLGSFRDSLGGLRDYIQTKHIVTIPSKVMPIIEETPPFMRALTSASMDTPGPYEKVAKEAFFNVTLPDPTWAAKDIDEYLQGFNRGTIASTAIHEAFPGHYVQFLWLPSVQTKVRKLMGCSSNAEGWAHYSEQMMLDEGFGNGDLKLRLGQLQDALLRDARYIVGIGMHTGDMSMEQAIDFFVKEGHQVRPTAEKETKRGTSDPTYLYYTLGKLEILKLREDYKAMKGDKYTLQGFHDAFLQQGTPPVKIVRKALLGNESPVL
jgi:uncharacterized protein (DUF885 family)